MVVDTSPPQRPTLTSIWSHPELSEVQVLGQCRTIMSSAVVVDCIRKARANTLGFSSLTINNLQVAYRDTEPSLLLTSCIPTPLNLLGKVAKYFGSEVISDNRSIVGHPDLLVTKSGLVTIIVQVKGKWYLDPLHFA